MTLRPPEKAKEPMNPFMIADLLMRLLAFSMVATAMSVTLRPSEKAKEPMTPLQEKLTCSWDCRPSQWWPLAMWPPKGAWEPMNPSIRITYLLIRLLAFSMVATAMSVTLRPPEGARETMNPSIRITYLLIRLLAFSMVATAMSVTLRPPEGASEPMNPSTRMPEQNI